MKKNKPSIQVSRA